MTLTGQECRSTNRSTEVLIRSAGALIKSTEVLIRSAGALMKSTEVLIRSAGAPIRNTEVLIRSTGALIRSTEVLIRSVEALIRTGVLCHLITDLRQFYNYMSSITYYLIIGAFLATLCVHDILYFMFMVMFQFVFIFHIIFMFHEHMYTYCISYVFLSCFMPVAYGISYTYTV